MSISERSRLRNREHSGEAALSPMDRPLVISSYEHLLRFDRIELRN